MNLEEENGQNTNNETISNENNSTLNKISKYEKEMNLFNEKK